VLVDCTETGCARHRVSGFGESSVLQVDVMVQQNNICKTFSCKAGNKQGGHWCYRRKKPDVTEHFVLVF